jgi:mannose-1-phosphate guanylyltransferase
MEKPNAATARGYCRSGEYFWNSGMFIWRASVIVREFKKHMPRHYRGYLRIKKALGKPSSGGVIKKVYAGLTAISIDYGIMEKADSVVVARADFDWDDAGSWLALERHFATDASGNVVLGEGLALDAERCIIVSDEGMVACHGVKDLIIVRTPDAVLVCHRDAAQDMKKITKRLRERQRWTRYT